MAKRCVVMFTKPARPGRVKTRLIGALTPEQAAELHATFVDDMLEELSAGAFDCRVAWALDRDESFPNTGFPSVRQHGSDLGERVWHGLLDGTDDYDFVAAVGSDHPEIRVGDVEAGFEQLEGGAEIVFGPVDDGGYYLIAARRDRLARRIFEEIPWSTDEVLELSLARCAELELKVEILPSGSDVDRPDDLARLRERLRVEPDLARHTARLLNSWDAEGAWEAS